MILVIGGRYGYVDSASAKSVTNLEYLVARAKGIPIYVFVQRNVLAIVPVWKSNPTANFSSVVDDPRVLEFIDEVRSVHKVWTHEFDVAQNIIDALRIRFAYLAKEGLSWSRRASIDELQSKALEAFRGRALRLVLERPRAWEYRLLFQVVRDELQALASARTDHRLGLAMGVFSLISKDNFVEVTQQRMAEIQAIVDVLIKLFEAPLQDALGPPGCPGDPSKIMFIGKRIGVAYSETMEWAHRVRRTSADELWAPVVTELARCADGIVDNIDSWAERGYQELEAASERTGNQELDLILKLEFTRPAI